MPTASRDPVRAVPDLGRACSSCTWSGARPTSRSRSRSTRSRRSSWPRSDSAWPGSSSSPGRSFVSVARSSGRHDASGAIRPSSAPCCSVAGWASSRGVNRPSRLASRRSSSPRCPSGSPSWAASSSGERLPRLAVAGILVGFAGVAILVGPSAFGGVGAMDPAGVAAILLSPVAWASGSLFASHRASLPNRPLVADRRPDGHRRRRPRGHGRWSPGSGRRSTRRRSRETRSSRSSTSRSSAACWPTRRTAGCSASLPCPSSRPMPT